MTTLKLQSSFHMKHYEEKMLFIRWESKRMKGETTLLITRKMPFKITMRYQFSPTRKDKNKRTGSTETMALWESSHTC